MDGFLGVPHIIRDLSSPRGRDPGFLCPKSAVLCTLLGVCWALPAPSGAVEYWKILENRRKSANQGGSGSKMTEKYRTLEAIQPYLEKHIVALKVKESHLQVLA